MDFSINGFFMKLFNISDMQTITECQSVGSPIPIQRRAFERDAFQRDSFQREALQR